MVENLYNLCIPSSKKIKGPGFIPQRAFGADFFPGTKHIETIVFLKRETLFEDYFWANYLLILKAIHLNKNDF